MEYISTRCPDLLNLEEFARGRALDALMGLASSPTAEFAELVQGYSGFGDLRNGWWNLPTMGYVAQARAIIYYMIFKAVAGVPARELIADLETLAAERGCEAQWLAAIAGATIEERVSLGADVELLPWAQIPDGMQKEVFSGRARSAYGFNPMVSTAGCGVRLRFKVSDLLLAANPGDGGMAAQAASQEARIAFAQDVVRCMTASGKRGPAITGYWIVLENKAAEEITGDAYSFTPAFSSPLRGVSVAFDAKEVADLYTRLAKFDGNERAAIRIALSIKWGSERPRRSSFHTTTTSPLRPWASALLSSGRSVRDPEARSSYIFSQPARFKASICRRVSCSSVETRA
jgi:hypothetical protein